MGGWTASFKPVRHHQFRTFLGETNVLITSSFSPFWHTTARKIWLGIEGTKPESFGEEPHVLVIEEQQVPIICNNRDQQSGNHLGKMDHLTTVHDYCSDDLWSMVHMFPPVHCKGMFFWYPNCTPLPKIQLAGWWTSWWISGKKGGLKG